MKKYLALIIVLAITFSFASCGNKQSADETVTDSQITDTSASEAVSETEALTDARYEAAVTALYNEIQKIKAENLDGEESLGETKAYMADMNGDGYKDIFYLDYDCYWWVPVLAVYDSESGEFVDCLSADDMEVLGGSIFPSGNEGGYFIDADKGIVVVRYDGHTLGTITYRAAQAFKVNGTQIEDLWKEEFDVDFDSVGDRYNPDVHGEEEVESLVCEEYNKQYLPRIADYNLVSFFDDCVVWHGEIL